ncbi:MAG TPA: type II secretion system ATPase GspE [Bacillota bacterium]|jgi:type II secretion system protein E|nr:type II secretion system ATPase GspE [Bacillota bacterium]HOL10810.1 type II secretion system ATPase GspE [Bacillota bacterium]HPO96437.1 type II secretion system ATPase GspE [Bacillota bacterium]
MEQLGDICLKQGWITQEQLDQLLILAQETEVSFAEVLKESKFVTEEEYTMALGIQLGLPYIQPLELNIDNNLLKLISPRQAEKLRALPLAFDNNCLTLVTDSPLNLDGFDQLKSTLNCRIKLAIASRTQMTEALNKYYGASLESVATVLEDFDESDLNQFQNLTEDAVSNIAQESMANEAPIIRLVNTIISGAVKAGASDIHLEPFEDEIKLRYRIDGVLQETSSPPKALYPAVVSRIKLMAGMDITERRIPQDGRIRLRLDNRDLDLRVAVAPTLFGEEVVMRILNRESILLGLSELGFNATNLKIFKELISKPHGMILVTGPTGSGKTTTLYAALQEVNQPTRKIITIEDPIEYQLKGVNQMQVNPKLNFTFAQGLRTIVRHDPDIILVGEIRDRETAEVAIQSALTGHLVFATLHTNDAPSAFTRLIDMGIEEFLVASTVLGVLAQRLVRKICPHCRAPYQANTVETDLINEYQLGNLQLTYGAGCEKCNYIGYRGQMGIFELLVINEEMERLIMERSNTGKIREAAIRRGMGTLREDGLSKVKEGYTTLAEVIRVTRD